MTWVAWIGLPPGLTHSETHAGWSFREQVLNDGVFARGSLKSLLASWLVSFPFGHPSTAWLPFSGYGEGDRSALPCLMPDGRVFRCQPMSPRRAPPPHPSRLGVFLLFAHFFSHFANASAVFVSFPSFSSEQSVRFDEPAASTAC